MFFEEKTLDLLDGTFKAVKVGGHFPGSSVLHWKSEKKLFIADSIMAVPSGMYHVDRPPNTASFTFMWSYPNMVSRVTYKVSSDQFAETHLQIPLPPDEVHTIWKAVADLDFDDTHGAFLGRDTRGNSKQRMLESAQIFVRSAGHLDHAIHKESI